MPGLQSKQKATKKQTSDTKKKRKFSVPIFGPKTRPEKGTKFGCLNKVSLGKPSHGPNFGSIFGDQKWDPKIAKKCLKREKKSAPRS